MNSRIIFGCGRLEGGVEYFNSIKLLREAFSLGINEYDIAPSYGGGDVEYLLRSAFSSNIKKINITTKVGLDRAKPISMIKSIGKKIVRPLANIYPVTKKKLLVNSIGKMEVDFIKRSLDETLHRLGVDSIDTLLLHEPRHNEITDEVLLFLEKIKSNGIARNIGTGTGQNPGNAFLYGDVFQAKFDPEFDYFSIPSNIEIRIHGIFRFSENNVSLNEIKHALIDSHVFERNSKIIFSTRNTNRLRQVVKSFSSFGGC